jgi:hypothetical protein
MHYRLCFAFMLEPVGAGPLVTVSRTTIDAMPVHSGCHAGYRDRDGATLPLQCSGSVSTVTSRTPESLHCQCIQREPPSVGPQASLSLYCCVRRVHHSRDGCNTACWSRRPHGVPAAVRGNDEGPADVLGLRVQRGLLSSGGRHQEPPTSSACTSWGAKRRDD